MYLSEGRNVNIANTEGTIDQVGCGNWGIIPCGGKNVVEPVRDALDRIRVAIYRYTATLQNHKPTQIIYAIHMVGVIMCVKGSIQVHQVGRQTLLPQVRSGVYNQISCITLHKD